MVLSRLKSCVNNQLTTAVCKPLASVPLPRCSRGLNLAYVSSIIECHFPLFSKHSRTVVKPARVEHTQGHWSILVVEISHPTLTRNTVAYWKLTGELTASLRI